MTCVLHIKKKSLNLLASGFIVQMYVCVHVAVLIPHEEVISDLQASTLHTSCGLGVKGSHFNCGNFPQIVEIKLSVSCALCC